MNNSQVPTTSSQSVHDLLDAVLRGDNVSLAQVRALLDRREPESIWHDYKRGAWLRDDPGPVIPGQPRKAAAKLRKWISGFANSEGGVLILGAADGSGGADAPNDGWRFTGCAAPGSAELDNWVSNALSPLVGYCRWRALLLPLEPNDFEGEGAAGHVVALIAVDRADQLVHCVEGQSIVTYLRTHESTVRAPEYLLRDILVGRRRQPDVQVEAHIRRQTVANFAGIGHATQLRWNLMLDNANLAWAEDVGLGVVAYTVRKEEQRNMRSLDPSPSVHSAMRDRGRCSGELWGDYVPPPRPGLVSRGPMQLSAMPLPIHMPSIGWRSQNAAHHVDIAPLTSGLSASYQAFVPGDFVEGVWCAGLYVVERNSRPRWFQMVVEAGAGPGRLTELPLGQGPILFYGPSGENSGLTPDDRAELGLSAG